MTYKFLKLIFIPLLVLSVSCGKKDAGNNPPAPQHDTLDDGLMAYYPFTGNANDKTGKNSIGTVNNAILTTDAKGTANSAYAFNGTDSYIVVTPGDSIRKIQTVSVAVKIFSESLNNSNFIFYWGNNSSGYPKSKYLINFSAVAPQTSTFFSVGEPSYCYQSHLGTASTFMDLTQNTWHSLVGIFNGSSIKMYLDGSLKDEQHVTYSFVPACTDDQVILLGRPKTDYYTSVKGKIDELRIYNRELTQAEISRLTNL